MTKGKNSNHPKKGSIITVDPIKSLKKIQEIKNLLKNHPRNYAIFILGINTNLRASDLVKITAGQVRYLKPMDILFIREQKTKKLRRINLNKSCIEAIQNLLMRTDLEDYDILFKGIRGSLKPTSINALVKSWCKTVNLKDNYGAHTLRKTFGYIQRTVFNVKLPVLTQCFNHSSQEATLTYLCIQDEELENVYANEI